MIHIYPNFNNIPIILQVDHNEDREEDHCIYPHQNIYIIKTAKYETQVSLTTDIVFRKETNAKSVVNSRYLLIGRLCIRVDPIILTLNLLTVDHSNHHIGILDLSERLVSGSSIGLEN